MRLSEEVLSFFRKQSFVIVTTMDPDGSPHNSCKDIIRITRDGRLYLLDLYVRQTFDNLKRNPKMSVAQVDEHSFSGYCLKGSGTMARITRMNPQIMRLWQNKITSRITERIIKNIKGDRSAGAHPESLLPRPEYMIVMDVHSVIDLTPVHIKRR